MIDRFTRTNLHAVRIAGIPVGLNLSWFLVFALVLWTLAVGYFPHVVPSASAWAIRAASLACALAFFASILAHELGHALAARHFGIEVKGITLFVLGGVSRIAEEPATAMQELVIAAAGPIVSLALAILGVGAGVFAPHAPLVTSVIAYLSLVNLALALFNMIPALPLDGGRVLRAMLWGLTDDVARATVWSAWAGRACGLVFVVVGLGLLAGGIAGPALWMGAIGLFVERSARGSLRGASESLSFAIREADMDAEAHFRRWMEIVISWRARLDALPRPGEIVEGNMGTSPAENRVYVTDRRRMYELVNDADAAIRARLSDDRIREMLRELGELYENWMARPTESSIREEPGDSILAGRPESFAPDPEEVLTREPGSSAEV